MIEIISFMYIQFVCSDKFRTFVTSGGKISLPKFRGSNFGLYICKQATCTSIFSPIKLTKTEKTESRILTIENKKTMKKMHLYLASMLVAAIVAVSCTKDITTDEIHQEEGNIKTEFRTVSASLECEESRTTLTDEGNGGQVFWSEGDTIGAISSDGTITQCTVVDIDGATARFSVPTDTEWAIYPYVSNLTFNTANNTLAYTLPNTRAIDGSNRVFGSNENVMCAHYSNDNLSFRNLCGYIEVRLKGTGSVKHIALRNNEQTWDALSGLGTIDFTNPDEPKITTGTNHGSTYNFSYATCSNVALSTSEATSFYFIVPPRTYNNLNICVQTDKGSYSITSQNAISVNRSKIRPIAEINIDELKPAISTDLSESGVANCYIVPQGSEERYFSFPARKINAAANLENVAYAHISWSESVSLVNNVCYDASTGMVSFKYEGNNAEGNAHIVLLNANHEVIWHNHIWCTDQPQTVVVASGNTNYAVMDRNLGATYAPKTVDEAKAVSVQEASDAAGLYYQYGRPSPFPRINSISGGNETTAFKGNSRVAVQYAFARYHQSLLYATNVYAYEDALTKYPKYFYYVGYNSAAGSESTYANNGTNSTWYGKTVYPSLWYSENSDIVSKKAANDPCPAGYVLDDMDSINAWMQQTYTAVTNTANSSTFGYYFQCPTTKNVAYFPAQGYRAYNNGKLSSIAANFNLWGTYVTPPTNNLDAVQVYKDNTRLLIRNWAKQSQGSGVRCRLMDRSELQNESVTPEAEYSISMLFIGNSLTEDSIAYLPYILKNYYPEVDFKIYMWYMPGKTLADHYSTFASSGTANVFAVAENSESWTNYKSSKTMKSVLADYKFDVVSMQEYFNYKSSYEDCTDWNNCHNYIVNNYKGDNELKFVSLFHAPLRKSGYNVNDVYKMTKTGNALILKSTASEGLIPTGMAVYNALSTDLNNLGDIGQLTNDGTHTQDGLPTLLQNYVVLCWIFEKLGMDRSIYGHPMRMTTDIYNRISVPVANLGSGIVQGTEVQYTLAQEVALKAYEEGKQFLNENL